MIWLQRNDFRKLNKNLSRETRILIVDKDKDLPVKEDQSTKRILNTFLTISTQRARRKHHIKSYASACIHNNIAKPYDEF